MLRSYRGVWYPHFRCWGCGGAKDRAPTLGFLLHGFFGRPELADFWGLGGPSGIREPFQKLGGPPSAMALGGRRGIPDPPNSTISGRPKNHVLTTQVYGFR